MLTVGHTNLLQCAPLLESKHNGVPRKAAVRPAFEAQNEMVCPLRPASGAKNMVNHRMKKSQTYTLFNTDLDLQLL